jgi:hypothetical protein
MPQLKKAFLTRNRGNYRGSDRHSLLSNPQAKTSKIPFLANLAEAPRSGEAERRDGV